MRKLPLAWEKRRFVPMLKILMQRDALKPMRWRPFSVSVDFNGHNFFLTIFFFFHRFTFIVCSLSSVIADGKQNINMIAFINCGNNDQMLSMENIDFFFQWIFILFIHRFND